MAWVEIRKKGLKETHLVTEEAFNDVFKANGFEIVNKADKTASTAQNDTVQASSQPKSELPSKRQYTKRNSVSDK